VSGAPREIALLGGSFNPPHVAHAMAAWWALATQGVDEVWLLPSFQHPFGKPLAPWGDRVRMCELAVAGLHGVQVCTAEAELEGDPLVGRTVRTLEHLLERHPGWRFALIVGTDVLAETDRWYRFDRVKQLARLIVVGRQGHAPAPGAPSLPDVSSTAIREAIAAGRDVSGLLPRRVARFVADRGLYRSA
jgi:nicotinate-nucleotide adenylyltransferase